MVAASKNHSVDLFQEYILRAIANYEAGCPTGKFIQNVEELAACEEPDNLPMADPLFLSLYGQQLRLWLASFDASQFVVAPMLAYVAPKEGTRSLLEYVAKDRLASSIKLNESPTAAEKNSESAGQSSEHQRPPLEEDLEKLGPAGRRAIEDLMRAQAGADSLAEVLSPSMDNGLVLFGYDGYNSDRIAIADWISSNW